MRQKKSSEFSRIRLLSQVLSQTKVPAPDVELGIGDDAAVLKGGGRLVWTIDTQVERIHFDRRWVNLDSIGYRSFQAALSDIAAMGARPSAALANLTLPEEFTDGELVRLVQGQAQAARECRCPLVGGNLARGAELSLSTTVLGRAAAPLLRSGARVSDELWLIGEVGMAGLGLAALSTGHGKSRSPAIRRCIARWRRPRALLREGQSLVGRAHAVLDVSDGLAGDAAHLAESSRVRIVIEAEKLTDALSPDLLRGARLLGRDPLQVALLGGEDYALLATGPKTRRPRTARVIGRVERGCDVVLEDAAGEPRVISGGFDHFLGK